MSRVLITGPTGRVAGVIARGLSSAHDIVAVARFSDPSARDRLEGHGVECVTADMAGDLSAVPDDAEILLNFGVSFSSDWDEALAVNAEASATSSTAFRGSSGCSTARRWASTPSRPTPTAKMMRSVTPTPR